MTPRQIALAEGLAQYRGKPCRRHPGALRWTSNGCCVACHVEKKKARQRANPEYFRAKQRARHSTDEYRQKRLERESRPEVQARKLERRREPQRKERRKARVRTDTRYRLTKILRARVHSALRGRAKSDRTMKLIGCSIGWLRYHLRRQFQPGMTWENHGDVWEIDHIRPCASFDLTKPEEQRACFHYTNLQPLWKRDNRAKNSRWQGVRYVYNVAQNALSR